MLEATIAREIQPIALKPRDAAKALSVSERTLRDLPIPKSRLAPGVVRYAVEDLHAYTERCKADDSQPQPGRPEQLRDGGRFAKVRKSKRGGRMTRRLVESANDSNQNTEAVGSKQITETTAMDSGHGSGREQEKQP